MIKIFLKTTGNRIILQYVLYEYDLHDYDKKKNGTILLKTKNGPLWLIKSKKTLKYSYIEYQYKKNDSCVLFN